MTIVFVLLFPRLSFLSEAKNLGGAVYKHTNGDSFFKAPSRRKAKDSRHICGNRADLQEFDFSVGSGEFFSGGCQIILRYEIIGGLI